jgi:L-serine dehydratase
MSYSSFAALLNDATQNNKTLAECVQTREAEESEVSISALRARIASTLQVMREAVAAGSEPDLRSKTGLSGGAAARMLAAADAAATAAGTDGQTPHEPSATNVAGTLFTRILGTALATVELNAAMGRIVAAPTAGASGVLPGVLLTIAEEQGLSDDALIDALLVAGALGACFATHATLAGAAGGCQAEVGTAAAMTAGAVVYLLGGSPQAVGHGATFALQGQLGLVCDPVAGLVEIPCVARNATGAAVALAGAQLALAGVTFPIPFDEAVKAAASVGASLPSTLRETAQGGLAQTPTGKRIAKRLAATT